MFSDATLLDISEVELADIKFLESDPVVVVQFNCQQVCEATPEDCLVLAATQPPLDQTIHCRSVLWTPSAGLAEQCCMTRNGMPKDYNKDYNKDCNAAAPPASGRCRPQP